MSETPRIPAQAPEALSGVLRQDRAPLDARQAGPAFEALLERLLASAAELEQRSRSLSSPQELPGAVDAARASLEDALTLGERLLEAYRASSSPRAPGEAAP